MGSVLLDAPVVRSPGAGFENYGAKNGMRMGYDFDGEIVPGVNEPLHTWEVFYWTPR